ncbi:MAG: hypothetical protein O3C40_11995 [Planctomycetota bacterium]|nr:hypothetical protein [Planctomycetota bacterium]
MLGYFDHFPEKTKTELRTAHFVEGSGEDLIPDGIYLFTEYFCTNPKCDCQRVLVKVLRVESEESRPEEVATISYTWNEHTDSIWTVVNADMPNPFLDPFHRQTRCASELLEFWYDMVQRDTAYVDRLKRHYHELRAAHSEPSVPSWTTSSGTSSAASPKTTTTSTLTRQERRARKRKLAQAKRIRKSR